MTTKQSQITYQSYASSHCLDSLIARFGDCLEKLTAIDKLDLISILALWQSADTGRAEAGITSISLSDYLTRNKPIQDATTLGVDEALGILSDCSDADALTLLVTLPCQLRDGVFAE
jgi:hypothetical protein